MVREKNLVPGAVVGRRQLAEARCDCIKERKATQCDCEQCTQITLSLARFNKVPFAILGKGAVILGRGGCHIREGRSHIHMTSPP